jgi:hypothetical protein
MAKRDTSIPDDPWNHPPIWLRVPASKINGYELKRMTVKDGQAFTPSLPGLKQHLGDAEVEIITLVPHS